MGRSMVLGFWMDAAEIHIDRPVIAVDRWSSALNTGTNMSQI